MATAMPIRLMIIVPATRGVTPKEAGSIAGDQSVPKRKSATPTSPKKTIVSCTSESTIPVVVRIETTAAATRRALMSFSP